MINSMQGGERTFLISFLGFAQQIRPANRKATMQRIKKCYKCKKNIPITGFNRNKARKDSLQTSCKNCQRKLSRNYYELNKKRCIEVIGINKRRRALENYIEIVTRYLNVPCVDCKTVYHPASMVFDHKVGSVKNIYKNQGVNYLIRDGYSRKAIKEEIEKCDVRCQNCHFLKTSKDFKHWKEIYGLVSDYSRLIRKLYKKHRNFYKSGAFKNNMESITNKFLGYALEKIRVETKRKREEIDNEESS